MWRPSIRHRLFTTDVVGSRCVSRDVVESLHICQHCGAIVESCPKVTLQWSLCAGSGSSGRLRKCELRQETAVDRQMQIQERCEVDDRVDEDAQESVVSSREMEPASQYSAEVSTCQRVIFATKPFVVLVAGEVWFLIGEAHPPLRYSASSTCSG